MEVCEHRQLEEKGTGPLFRRLRLELGLGLVGLELVGLQVGLWLIGLVELGLG